MSAEAPCAWLDDVEKVIECVYLDGVQLVEKGQMLFFLVYVLGHKHAVNREILQAYSGSF